MYGNDVLITETILAVFWATSILVLLCWLFSRAATGATFQRAVWRTAVLGVIILTWAELSGCTAGIHAWIHGRLATRQDMARTGVESVADAADQEEIAYDLQWRLEIEQPADMRNNALAASLAFDSNDASATNRLAASHLAPENVGVATAHDREQETLLRFDTAAEAVVAKAGWLPTSIGWIEQDHRGFSLLALWFLGTVLSLVKMVWNQVALMWFQARQPFAGGEITRRAHGRARQLGIGRRVCVRTSYDLASHDLAAPVAFGVFRPTIVLPSSFRQQFSLPQQDAVLTHELAHLAARDPLWQLAASFACALLWWQPLVWFARKHLRVATEWAADEATALIPNGPECLAECLVALGRQMTRSRRLLWLSAVEPRFRSGLALRVTRLLSLKSDRKSTVPRRCLQRSVIAVMLMFSVAATGWTRSHSFHARGDTEMNMLAQSWRRSVVGAAVLAAMGFGGTNFSATRADERAADDELRYTSEDERIEDVNVQAFLVTVGSDEEEQQVHGTNVVFDASVAVAENSDREDEESRRQYGYRGQDEDRKDRGEEIRKRLGDKLAKLPEDRRQEIIELIEGLLDVERAHFQREVERRKVEMQRRLEEPERQFRAAERALEEAARTAAKLHWEDRAKQERQYRQSEQRLPRAPELHFEFKPGPPPKPPRIDDGGDRRSPGLDEDLLRGSRDGNPGMDAELVIGSRDGDMALQIAKKTFGKYDDQLREMHKQMSQMHRQMSEMQRAMEKLMRSSGESSGDAQDRVTRSRDQVTMCKDQVTMCQDQMTRCQHPKIRCHDRKSLIQLDWPPRR